MFVKSFAKIIHLSGLLFLSIIDCSCQSAVSLCLTLFNIFQGEKDNEIRMIVQPQTNREMFLLQKYQNNPVFLVNSRSMGESLEKIVGLASEFYPHPQVRGLALKNSITRNVTMHSKVRHNFIRLTRKHIIFYL